MMKKWTICLTILLFGINATADFIYIDDGLSHTFDDQTYVNDWIYLDYYTINDPGTHLNLVDGGVIGGSLNVLHNATVNMQGGRIAREINTFVDSQVDIYDGHIQGFMYPQDNSVVTMYGGVVDDGITTSNNAKFYLYGGSGWTLRSIHNSEIHMDGGYISYSIEARDTSTVYMSGGSIGYNLIARHESTIYLVGTDFSIGSISLECGDRLSDFANSGTIHGILRDGTPLNNFYKIDNPGFSDIVIIPEPVSFSLLALGMVLLGSKKR